jgi:hypothetical protein
MTTIFGDSLRKRFFLKVKTVMGLRALIIQACNEITEDMCLRITNITVGVEEVARHNLGHIDDSQRINLRAMLFLFVC